MSIEFSSVGVSPVQISAAVQIQIKELSGGFLSSLGPRPLGLIFEHAALSRFGILVVAVDSEDGTVVGYVLGATNTGSFYKDFLRHHWAVALRHFVPRLISVERMRKAVETLLYPLRGGKAAHGAPPAAELLDLAVTREMHGSGVAQGLFMAFVAECRLVGVEELNIPTTAGLDRAHRFYEKMGAVRESRVEVHKGEDAFVYRYSLTRSA